MKKSLVLILVIALFLIANVSAGIYFSQPEQAYNLGDIIINDITVDSNTDGFLKVDLVCEDNAVNIFNGIPSEGKVHIKFPLTTAYIQDISGECYFLGKYGQAVQQSRSFQISKILNIWLDIDSLFAKPGEEVIISGSVERLNRMGANGGIEISIPLLSLIKTEENTEDLDINSTENNETETQEETVTIDYNSGKFFGSVVNGSFSVAFNLEEDMPAGDYRIDVLAYEESSGIRTSEGVSVANLRVSQILTKVEIVLSLQNLNPGEDLSFKPRLLDQSGQSIEEEVSVIIRDEDLNRIFERIIPSEETINYNIPTNMSAGYYEIEASSSGLSEVKNFYVNEKKIVSLELVNQTLIVTNIGNVILKDYSIQIELNGKPFVRKVNLGLGEKQEFKLTGDGTYDIKISDGEKEFSQGGVVLTGDAVGVESIKKAGSLALGSPIVWIFFIIILGGGLLFFLRDIFKKKSFAYPFRETLKRKFSKNSGVVELKVAEQAPNVFEKNQGEGLKSEQKQQKTIEKNKFSPVTSTNQAERVLVLDGQKSKATILILSIKNKLDDFSKQNLEKSIEHVYEKKAAVYEKGDSIFIIFSPLMTKTFRNEVEAAKAGERILLFLTEHNKKFKEKIDFGIGIHSGDIINKIEDKKLKFTALGNLVIVARKLAEVSDKQILMSKETYEKAMNDIKAVKKNIKDVEAYEVQKVIDREQNKEFISGFLNRMEKEEKSNQNQKYSGQGI